jgi:NTP pyrophosphatase (non-canonical NTP hydrolase)
MWTMADWSNAMVGEVGELVDATGALLAVVSHSGQLANIIKKLRRLECGSDPGPDDPPAYRLLEMVADEMGDVVAYLDLLATFLGIDLGAAVANKFNRVSEHQGFSERLP